MPAADCLSGRHDVGQGNVQICHHLQSDNRYGASTKLIEFHLNSVTNLRQLTSHSTTSYHATWRSYRDHGLL